MKLEESDFEESYFHSIRRSNDKSVAYLFVVIALLLFFGLFLFGMTRAQQVTEHTSREFPRIGSEISPDISDVNGPAIE